MDINNAIPKGMPIIQPFERLKNGRTNLILHEDFNYDIPNTDLSVLIPKGFTTDFGSVPRLFHCIVQPIDLRWIRATLVHDWGYEKGDVLKNGKHFGYPSRSQWDNFFKDIMLNGEETMPKYIAIPSFYAVKMLGRSKYELPKEVQKFLK